MHALPAPLFVRRYGQPRDYSRPSCEHRCILPHHVRQSPAACRHRHPGPLRGAADTGHTAPAARDLPAGHRAADGHLTGAGRLGRTGGATCVHGSTGGHRRRPVGAAALALHRERHRTAARLGRGWRRVLATLHAQPAAGLRSDLGAVLYRHLGARQPPYLGAYLAGVARRAAGGGDRQWRVPRLPGRCLSGHRGAAAGLARRYAGRTGQRRGRCGPWRRWHPGAAHPARP